MSEDNFESLIGDDGVEKLNLDKRVTLTNRAEKDASENQRRAAALAHAKVVEDPLSGGPEEMLGPNDFLSFQRPGVQHGVFKNLRLGKYEIDAVLDMHRMTVEEARKSLWSFIRDCRDNDVRTALVTHGKGEGRERPALLKSHVAYWLPQIEDVLAFHTAQKRHGSYGATYVLIRKSDKEKFANKMKNEGRK
jgi:DNA-nicking Smr family endonuclease